MLAVTNTYLIADEVNQEKLFENIDVIHLKALECIENGHDNALFKDNGFIIQLVYSKDIDSLETDDKYCLLIKNEEEE